MRLKDPVRDPFHHASITRASSCCHAQALITGDLGFVPVAAWNAVEDSAISAGLLFPAWAQYP
jgi:hypothetical protein